MSDSPSRTQAERRAVTRRALLDAAIDLLMNKGLGASSLAAVARHAGMTTGAVQHHFKTKAALMRAVISERLFDRSVLAEQTDLTDASLEERSAALVAQQWQFYGNPKYIAIWDIILGARADSDIREEILSWQQSGVSALEAEISKLFSAENLNVQQVQSIQYFMNAHLRGLALLRTVENDDIIISQQLALLSSLLAQYIQDLS